jgi:hypothetical protein
VGDDNHLLFRQKLLGEDGSVRRGVVITKQPSLFSLKFGATSSHIFTQSPQNVAVEPGIHSLACWDWCFALPQLLYRWRYQSGTLDTTSHMYFMAPTCVGLKGHRQANSRADCFPEIIFVSQEDNKKLCIRSVAIKMEANCKKYFIHNLLYLHGVTSTGIAVGRYTERSKHPPISKHQWIQPRPPTVYQTYNTYKLSHIYFAPS